MHSFDYKCIQQWRPDLCLYLLLELQLNLSALVNNCRASQVVQWSSACQSRRCRRCVFDPWVRKIPWRRKWPTHSSILAWKVPWTQEPGGLQSVGLQRVRHDWATSTVHTWTHTHSIYAQVLERSPYKWNVWAISVVRSSAALPSCFVVISTNHANHIEYAVKNKL